MRKTLFGALAAAFLLGGAAYADVQGTQGTSSSTSATTTTQSTTTTPVGHDQAVETRNGQTYGSHGLSQGEQLRTQSEMGQQGTASAPNAMANQAGASSFQGQVDRVKKDRLTIKDQSGKKEQVFIDNGSTILRDGQVASANQLKKGDDVRVSFDLRNGKHYATTITATSAAGQGGSGALQGGSGRDVKHNTNDSNITQPAAGTGEGTKTDSSLNDSSTNGNTPGTQYRKESGRQNGNSDNSGYTGHPAAQDDKGSGSQSNPDAKPDERPVNPSSNPSNP